ARRGTEHPLLIAEHARRGAGRRPDRLRRPRPDRGCGRHAGVPRPVASRPPRARRRRCRSGDRRRGLPCRDRPHRSAHDRPVLRRSSRRVPGRRRHRGRRRPDDAGGDLRRRGDGASPGGLPMNSAMIRLLVAKDWRFQRLPLLLAVIAGAAGLGLMLSDSGGAFYIGVVLVISVVITLGIYLAFLTVVHERTDGVLPFVMSLPIGVRDWTAAKLV